MSLIDDALKRAQAAGEGEAARPTNRPWTPAPLPDPAIARRRAAVRWLGIAAAALLVAGAGAWFVRREFGSPGPHPLPAGEGRGEGRPAAVVVPQPTATPDAVALATPIVVAPARPTRLPQTAVHVPAEGEAEAVKPAPAPVGPRAPQAVADGKNGSQISG